MMMRRICAFLLTAAVIFTLAGCAKTLEPQQVTMLVVGGDIALYQVHVVTQDLVVSYDLTEYWLNNSYNYFEDPLPPSGTYTVTPAPLSPEGWVRITTALNKNKFAGLPDTIDANGTDMETYQIEVITPDGVYSSSGYGAVYKSERFAKIVDVIREECKI